MAIADRDFSEHRQLLARILLSIPRHEEREQSASQIAARVAPAFDHLPPDLLEFTTNTVLVVLSTFGVLYESAGRYRCRSEMPEYFVHSYAWYVANAQALLNNWTRPGVGDDITISTLLDAAPYLLKIAEGKRLKIAEDSKRRQRRTLNVEPARTRRVACVLLKTVVDGRPHFLFEWDNRAAQYQLIGGHINDDEEPIGAAAQELMEEVATVTGQRLEPGRHFEIRSLAWETELPLDWTGVSRTVGALTRYTVWAYGVQLDVGQLRLREHCRWLNIDEMLAGETEDGRRTGDARLYEIMDATLTGGLAGVPISLGSDAIPGLRHNVASAHDGGTRVFIGHGHSAAWRELAEHLRDRHGYHVVTYESERQPGHPTTEVLTRLIEQASFAILVHTAEDEQAGGGLHARQNVVHETGLFQGRLGFAKAIIVRQRGCDAFSNLAGLQELHYTAGIREAFGEVIAALRRALES